MDTLREDLHKLMMASRWILLRMRNISESSVANIRAYILEPIFFLSKSCRLWDNVEKYDTARQYDTVHAFCVLDN
jgi:hypothetical protein